jgi:hypothetical protein
VRDCQTTALSLSGSVLATPGVPSVPRLPRYPTVNPDRFVASAAPSARPGAVFSGTTLPEVSQITGFLLLAGRPAPPCARWPRRADFGKSSVAKYLKLAKQEEAAAELEAEREAEPQPLEPDAELLTERLAEPADRAEPRAPEPEERPAAKVWLAGQEGLRTVRGGRVSPRSSLVLPPRRYREGQMAVIESNERAALVRQAFTRAGLSRDGFASCETSIARGSCDPADPADVQRVRSLIRADDGDAVADAWTPHRGLR